MSDRFDEMAGRVQRVVESYALRQSIDGRRRVIAEALRASYERGRDEHASLERDLAELREAAREAVKAGRVARNGRGWAKVLEAIDAMAVLLPAEPPKARGVIARGGEPPYREHVDACDDEACSGCEGYEPPKEASDGK